MIVCFSGKAHAGKSTHARLLRQYIQEQGTPATVLPLAAPVKAPVAGEHDDGLVKDRDRGDLIVFGTEVVRKIDVNRWITIGILTIQAYFMWRGPNAVVLIDDTRFRNEILGLQNTFGDHNVYTVRLTRHVTNITNISERDLDTYPFDYTIPNADMTISEAQMEVRNAYRHMRRT